MDGFTSVLTLLLVILVVMIVVLSVLKMGKQKQAEDVSKKVVDFFKNSEKEKEDSEEGSNGLTPTLPEISSDNGQVKNTYEWLIKSYSPDGDLMRETGFSRSFFEPDDLISQEIHFGIGRALENNLSIDDKYNTVGNYHAFIRYDADKNSYIFWEDKATYGTFFDSQKINKVSDYVEITNGLELYLAGVIRLVFTKN